ncbi:hypothetical protein ACET3Z_028801 [Daucus carota]
MSNEGRTDNGGVEEEIPPESKKMVESLKEIVHCAELEIYSALKDSNMDPNEAVNRLLSQDPFHQVKSKREKKKENKDLPETKFRVSSTLHRGSKSDRGRGASAQLSSFDSSSFQGKLAYKKENGANSYTTSLSVPQVAVDNSSWRPSAFSTSVSMENQKSKRSVVGAISASQTNSGYRSASVGVPGRKSVANIVKKGGHQSNAANSLKSSQSSFNWPPKSSEFYKEFSSSENQVLKVTDQFGKQVAPPDEQPLLKPPENANLSSVLASHAESQLHPVLQDLPCGKATQHLHSEKKELKEGEEKSFTYRDDYHVGSAMISSGTQGIKPGNALLFGDGINTKLGPYQSYNYACQNEEVKDGVATSKLSETATLQHLSTQEEEQKPSYEEDGSSVLIPDHLQVNSAGCSYLSFGSFKSNLVIGVSGSISSRNNMEETPIVANAFMNGKDRNRKIEKYREDSFLKASDEILAHRNSRVAGTFNSASATQSDFLKQEYSEAVGAHGNEYPFQKACQNFAFDYTQKSSWMQNLPSSDAMGHTDPFSSARLTANFPIRDSEFSYSPFPVAQSVALKYGNSVSSTNGSSISLEEALKTGLQSLHSTQQHLSGKHASEQSDPQHLPAHQNSQPVHPFGPFANMNSYSYVPQDETYMPFALQQAFAGNGTYHQSLGATLPQYKNSVSLSSLPQPATVSAGYGNFEDSMINSGNYALNPSVVPAGSTIGYEDLLSTRYKDSSYSISPQQNENSAMWFRGDDSRTMSTVPPSTYYSLQGQNQHSAGFGQGQQSSLNYGDANFYNPQTGMPFEQQLQSPRNGSVGGSYVQSKQIWQNSY